MTARVLFTLAAALVLAAAPAAAQEDIGFKPVPDRDIVLPPHSDADVEKLIATLDSLLAREKDPAAWAKSGRIHFWRFLNRLQQGTLTARQEARILKYFDDLAVEHSTDAPAIAEERELVRTRTIGKLAPDIVGKDLDGVEFKLSDYRGKVVVLVFSGDWCGPCRSEYPYQRLLLELYKDRPFAIVSVNSDTLEVAQKAKVEKKLDYRSWWDGNQKETTKGPIATAWNVTGWPTTYVLDEKGAIRFANLRAENLLKGVKQLMSALPRTQTAK